MSFSKWEYGLLRLGWVRRKRYDQLADNYARLVSRYMDLRNGVDRVLADVKKRKEEGNEIQTKP